MILTHDCIVRYIFIVSKNNLRPNEDIYAALQRAADHFNAALFEGELPPVLITLQRGRNTFGYFSPDRWAHASGRLASEIAINPAYFAHQSVLQVLQTLVHELCHLWQHEFGTPTRPGYHNREWAKKMLAIGLIPSSTGVPGGEQIGQKMSDYPAEDGPFMLAAGSLAEGAFNLNWIDRGFEIEPVFERSVPENCRALSNRALNILNTPVTAYFKNLQAIPATKRIDKRKVKYMCSSCGTKVWGKPGLAIRCDDCDQIFLGASHQEHIPV